MMNEKKGATANPRFKTCSPGHCILVIQVSIFMLLGTVATAQECNYQQRVCECDPGQTECYFTLKVENLISFTSYKLTTDDSGRYTGIITPRFTNYVFNSSGMLQPRNNATYSPYLCSTYDGNYFDIDCSIPMTTDSTIETVIKTVNGLLPGPTLVVSYNQTVVVDVQNSLLNEGLSIHWYGMYQNKTHWMDGVEHISQCPIPTFTTVRYIFKAVPSGTMWYQSQTAVQRIEGVFGSLIVRESDNLMKRAEQKLHDLIGEEFELLDEPHHTLNFLDWSVPAADITLSVLTQLDIPLPFRAGLINGLGREMSVPYERSKLSIFNVQYRKENSRPLYYRFRLIGAQNSYMYRFSIADHKLIVIATDGHFTEPIEVDYISFHSGERYDFLLKPKTEAEANGRTNFPILAVPTTAEHRAEAILHYGTDADQPLSTEYEEIFNSLAPRSCTQESFCTNLNCPFLEYPVGTLIKCIPVTQMRLLFETEDEVPSNDVEDENEYFFDFSRIQPTIRAAINGRRFITPSGSLQTQHNSFKDLNICQVGQVNCVDDPELCFCTYVMPLNNLFATTQFVLSTIGDGGLAYHPVHLHGHSFQVVGIFFGTYDSDGHLVGINPNVTCSGDPKCTDPTWTSSRVDGGEVSSKTVRKDTIVIPAGGYVVIRFIADNPGYWFMHSNVELELLQGMALVVNELNYFQNPPPHQLAMQNCGNFNFSVEEFNRLNIGYANLPALGPMDSASNVISRLYNI